MAKLYVTEYCEPIIRGGNAFPVATGPALVEQVVTYTTSTQSAAFGATTAIIRVHTDSICSISIGADPTATTSMARMAAGTTEYFRVHPGHKIAAVTNT